MLHLFHWYRQRDGINEELGYSEVCNRWTPGMLTNAREEAWRATAADFFAPTQQEMRASSRKMSKGMKSKSTIFKPNPRDNRSIK
jgi:ribosomal protein S2